ncbi:hypothetical protein BKA70DRAFT_1447641 [Coprinopsis sp. MPI-PUGE-AT-0042]|nr:hypothetical protein BKA70DRAFT_1447641 [Coprinopsis sp. MPI-PUGE-AT-0042]
MYAKSILTIEDDVTEQFPSQDTEMLSINVGGLSKHAQDFSDGIRYMRFNHLRLIILEAAASDWVFTSGKDDPIRHLAKGLRALSASPVVHVQLDCVVYGLTYCSFTDFSWSNLDNALVRFSERHHHVTVLIRFVREFATGERPVAYTPPGYLAKLLPLSTTRPNLVVNTAPSSVVDPQLMYRDDL